MSEKIYACYYCKKVFAISDNAEGNICPKCGKVLNYIHYDTESWRILSEDEHQRILSEAYYKNKQNDRQKSSHSNNITANQRHHRKEPHKESKVSFHLKGVITILGILFIIVCLFLAKKLLGDNTGKKYESDNISATSEYPVPNSYNSNADNQEIISSNGSKNGKEIIVSNENDTSNFDETDRESSSEERHETLMRIIDEYIGEGNIEEIIEDDYTGDGIEDMIIEVGKSSGDEWIQYFVFTDGINTYEFGEYSNSVLYESTNSIISVDNTKQLVNSSSWRAAALGGQLYHSSIYSIGSDLAYPVYSEEFSNITQVDDDNDLVYVSYYEKASPGGEIVDRGILHDTGDEVEPFIVCDGISPDYKEASVLPQMNPESVWAGIRVQEVVGSYGIHFYVPADWDIYANIEDRYDNTLYFKASNSGGYSEWIVSTSCYTYKGEVENFDWGEGQYVYRIGSIGDEHFYVCVASGAEDVEPMYNPNIYFPELEHYREMIGNTAWVE